MTRKYRNSVDIRVIDDLVVRRSRILETEFFSGVLRMESACGGDANKLDVTGFFDGRQEGSVGKETGAENTEIYDLRFSTNEGKDGINIKQLTSGKGLDTQEEARWTRPRLRPRQNVGTRPQGTKVTLGIQQPSRI